MIRLSIALILVSATSSLADDGFTAIHAANQKIGSEVAQFWSRLVTEPASPTADSFMTVHMANQKIGSTVANFWLLESRSYGAIVDVAEEQPSVGGVDLPH